jgi:hypothetical protein
MINKLFQAYNNQLKCNLIKNDYVKLEISKGYDKAFDEPCQLPSLKIDKAIKN